MSSHTDTTAIPDDESNAPTQYVPKAKYDALLASNQQLREALRLIISEHGLINPKIVAEAALAAVGEE